MVDRELQGPGACSVDEHWQETVHTVERKHPGQNCPFENPDRTPRICEINAQHQLSGSPSHDSRNAPKEIVLAADSDATHEIVTIQCGKERRKVLRIILAISIHRRDDRGCRGLDPCPQRRALAAIHGVPQTSDAPILALCLLNCPPSAVGAAIVNKNNFKLPRARIHGFRHLSGQRQNVILFIEHGDDDR